jgi:hypothetical protein
MLKKMIEKRILEKMKHSNIKQKHISKIKTMLGGATLTMIRSADAKRNLESPTSYKT